MSLTLISNALKAAKQAAYAVGLKEPWKVTGAWSLPDFLHFLPSGLEYRKFSPGTPPVKVIIPHDVPQLVYNTKYYPRDYRRNSKYTARTVDAKTDFDFDKLYAAAPLKPEEVKKVPLPKTMPTHGY